MSNRVNFVIVAKDAFSAVARNVSKNTKKMSKNFKALKLDMSGLKSKFTGLIASMVAFSGV